MKHPFRLKMPTKIPKISNRNLNTKKIIRYSVGIAAVLTIASAYLAYTRLYITPERRFWMAIENNLSTSSIVRETQTGGSGNKSIDKTRFEFGSQASQNKISSVSVKSATTESNVTTESITTPNKQYVRYVNVFSSEKKADGSEYDFEKIKNVWAKQDDATDVESKERLRLGYIQPLVTLVPFGNLAPSKRNDLVKKLQGGSYVVDFERVTYSVVNGRRYAMYDVKVQTKKYVAVLQEYFRYMGLGDFPPLDPSGYPDKARVNASFLIDTRSNTLSAVAFNGQNEHYQDYGVQKQVKEPGKVISLTELQERLQAAQ